MSGRVAPADRTRQPRAGPARPLQIPEFHGDLLPNGLEIRVAERHELPEVSLRLVLRAGARAEPPERCGAAELTGRLLTEGAAGRSAQEMASWIDRIGAGFGVSVRYDTTLISMHCLSDGLDEALDFLAAAVLEPAFESAEVDRVRQERLDEIERERDEPATVAGRALIEAVYGPHHPYGRPAAGRYDTVAGLGPDEVRAFHGEAYAARGTVLVVCGDVRMAELAADVRRRFGAWAAGRGPEEPPPAPVAAARAGRVVLVDRPGSAQSEVRVGGIGAPAGAPDAFHIKVANAILGGLFNSRINMNLREDKGWTYGARTAFVERRGAGPFVASAAVETGVTAAAFGELRREIDDLSARPPTAAEIRLARGALTRSLPRQFETVRQVSGKVAHQVALGLPEDYWMRYRERVEGVGRDEVERVAERYLRPESLVSLAVAEAAAVRADLAALGPVEEVAAP